MKKVYDFFVNFPNRLLSVLIRLASRRNTVNSVISIYPVNFQLLFLLLSGCLRFPVGITDDFIIPDLSITASDSDGSDFDQYKARMSDSSAWCLPVVEPDSPYLQVDFGEDVLVCAVETRGYKDDDDEELYAQEFTLSFEAEGESSFTEYMEDGEIRVRLHLGYLSASSFLTFRIP